MSYVSCWLSTIHNWAETHEYRTALTHKPVNRQDMSTIVLYRKKMDGVFLVSKVTAFSVSVMGVSNDALSASVSSTFHIKLVRVHS
jgi:hypothetical protein